MPSWLDRLFRRRPTTTGPSASSIRFDTAGWRVKRKKPHERLWRNAEGDTLSVRVYQESADHLRHLADIEQLRAFYRDRAAAAGRGIVSVEVVSAAGVLGAKVIEKFKERPANSYEGTLAIPLKSAHCAITVRSTEHGMTGFREAIVTALLRQSGELELPELPESDRPVKRKGWCLDPYDPRHDTSALYSLSDDPRLDALFPDHPLSNVRMWLTRVQETLRIDQEVISDYSSVSAAKSAASSPPRTALSSRAVGTLYFDMGKVAESQRFVEESIAEFERTNRANHPEAAEQMLLLGFIHEYLGADLKSESMFSNAMKIFETTLGPDDPHTMQAAINLGRARIALGNHAEARPLFERALSVDATKRLPGSLAGLALYGLGVCLSAGGLYSDAVSRFEGALEIFEEVHGPDFPDCATVLRNMAASFQAMGEFGKAADALKRARKLTAESENSGSESP